MHSVKWIRVIFRDHSLNLQQFNYNYGKRGTPINCCERLTHEAKLIESVHNLNDFQNSFEWIRMKATLFVSSTWDEMGHFNDQ